MSKTLEIQLLGKLYSAACPVGHEQQLLKSAKELDHQLEQMRLRTGVLNIEQLAVMAALNLNHELLALQKKQAQEQAQLAERITLLQQTIEHSLNGHLSFEPKTLAELPQEQYTKEV